MLTFFAFLLAIAGGLNWLSIGLLQYDFIAGLFGFQASLFSRIVYILFGVGAVYIVIRMIVNKGKVKLFERKKKKENLNPPTSQIKTQNVEAGREFVSPAPQGFAERQTNNFFEPTTPPKAEFSNTSTTASQQGFKERVNFSSTYNGSHKQNETYESTQKNNYHNDFFNQHYDNPFYDHFDDRFDK